MAHKQYVQHLFSCRAFIQCLLEVPKKVFVRRDEETLSPIYHLDLNERRCATDVTFSLLSRGYDDIGLPAFPPVR